RLDGRRRERAVRDGRHAVARLRSGGRLYRHRLRHGRGRRHAHGEHPPPRHPVTSVSRTLAILMAASAVLLTAPVPGARAACDSPVHFYGTYSLGTRSGSAEVSLDSRIAELQ